MYMQNEHTSEDVETMENELPQPQGDDSADAPAAGPLEVQPGEREAEEVRRLKEERDNLSDQLLRAMADFDNARKRLRRESEEQRAYAAMDVLRGFLPVLDGFERALGTTSGSLEDFQKGVDLIYRQMLEAAKKAGLQPIEAVGKPFDPHQHEAIESVTTEAAPDQSVVEELQRGYKFRDRIVRPAMVRVARNPRS